MKIPIKLKRVKYTGCENCFFYHLNDCNILNDTKFDCKNTSMFIVDKEEDLTVTFDIGETE